MASESISFVLNRLSDEAVKEAALLKGVDKDIMLLRDKLEWMQTFIQHADQKRRQRANNYITLWVRQTRDVAHDAEDVLDEFLRKVDLGKIVGRSRWGQWLRITTSLITQVAVRHDLSARIENIKSRLQEIADNVDKYCASLLSPDESSALAKSSISADEWYRDDEMEVFGFLKEREDLKRHLLSSDTERFVIPIVGESGIGKSTLAWEVYDSEDIRREFPVRAWINVPPQIRESDILYFMYECLCLEGSGIMFASQTDEDESVREAGEDKSARETGEGNSVKETSEGKDIRKSLSDYLKKKRYLVMLDGLANFTTFKSILGSLPDEGTGSRVMITTRFESKDEAENADPTIKPVKIERLSQDDSKSLFLRKVYGAKQKFRKEVLRDKRLQPMFDQEPEHPQSVQEQPQPKQEESLLADREIEQPQSMQEPTQPKQEEPLPTKQQEVLNNLFKITEGLPLAIVVLAGLLRTKNIADWGKMFEQINSSDEPKRLKRILTLSFDDLPGRLKSCFLYFAGMPENLVLNAGRIVRLWAAEGFLKPKLGMTMEDVGENYLKQLISRELVQVEDKDLNGGVWRVSIHDRIHSFAQSEAQDASFMEVHDNPNVLEAAPTRRLYLQNYTQAYTPLDTTSFPKLRSILCDFSEERNPEDSPQSWGSRLKNLASCGGYYMDQPRKDVPRYHALRFLPKSKFLRVIDFRGLRIKKLPPAIGDLIHVRYLGLRCQSLDTLPPSIVRLINLQTLDIKRSRVKAVAQGFWKTPTLRHVIANNKLELPESVVALNNMQTLTGIVCGPSQWTKDICPLGNMVHLRYLEVGRLRTRQQWEGLADAFKKMESLLYLRLEGVQEGVQIPASKLFTNYTLHRLQILELKGKISRHQQGQEISYTLPNLTRLVLHETMVDQEFMNDIGKLPSLKELVLSEKAYDGAELLLSDDGFNMVKNLVLAGLPKPLKWTIRSGSIPKIKTIALASCPDMTIKLELQEGETGLESLMKDLKEVVVWKTLIKMDPENKESENKAFNDKINKITMKAMSEDLTNVFRRTGLSRAGTMESDMHFSK